jgi:hypothetical protein
MLKYTKEPKGYQIKTVGQLFKEYWHLRKIKSYLLSENYGSEKDFTNPPALISDCYEYIDVWTYDEGGEPVKKSVFIDKLKKLGFEQNDWLHCYTFRSVYVGDGKYVLLDYHVGWRHLMDLAAIVFRNTPKLQTA